MLLGRCFNQLGFSFNLNEEAVKVLNTAYENGWRLKITFNDNSVKFGYLSLGNGLMNKPTLRYRKDSFFGDYIKDESITKIEFSNKKNGGVIYQKITNKTVFFKKYLIKAA